MIFDFIITILAFWVGTAVDPLFWLIAIVCGIATMEPSRAWIRPLIAVGFGAVRCLVLPGLLAYGVRPDWPLIVIAVAVEFWFVAWLAARIWRRWVDDRSARLRAQVLQQAEAERAARHSEPPSSLGDPRG